MYYNLPFTDTCAFVSLVFDTGISQVALFFWAVCILRPQTLVVWSPVSIIIYILDNISLVPHPLLHDEKDSCVKYGNRLSWITSLAKVLEIL